MKLVTLLENLIEDHESMARGTEKSFGDTPWVNPFGNYHYGYTHGKIDAYKGILELLNSKAAPNAFAKYGDQITEEVQKEIRHMRDLLLWS